MIIPQPIMAQCDRCKEKRSTNTSDTTTVKVNVLHFGWSIWNCEYRNKPGPDIHLCETCGLIVKSQICEPDKWLLAEEKAEGGSNE